VSSSSDLKGLIKVIKRLKLSNLKVTENTHTIADITIREISPLIIIV
jgi:hypothetical protein